MKQVRLNSVRSRPLRRGEWPAQLAECPFGAIEKLAPLRVLAKDQGGGSIPGELRFPLPDQRLTSGAKHNGFPASLQIDRISVRLYVRLALVLSRHHAGRHPTAFLVLEGRRRSQPHARAITWNR